MNGPQTFKYFEAQDPGEKVLFTVRKHWFYLIRPFVYGLFIVGLWILVYLLLKTTHDLPFEESWLKLVLGLLTMFTALFSYIVWLIKYLTTFLVTSERLVSIDQLALFVRKTAVLEYSSVEDVTVTKKGFFATVFNYGTVLIQTAAEKLNFEITYIPDPEGLQDKIMELRDKFIVNESEYEERGLDHHNHHH